MIPITKIKTIASIITVIAGCLLLFFLAYKAGYNAAKYLYEKELRIQQIERDKERELLQAGINDMALKWLNLQPEKQIIYRDIKKEIPIYVKTNPVCNLNNDTVRLLNQAANPERMPKASNTSIIEATAKAFKNVTN